MGKKQNHYFQKYRDLLLLAICLVLGLVLLTCFQVVCTDDYSMDPTYTPGDVLLSLKVHPAPQVNDIVLIYHDGMYMVKRVQFVAGQVPYLFTGGNDLNIPPLEDWLEGPIPEGYIFVAGDNPAVSKDSRYEDFGLVSLDEVRGIIICTLKGK